MAAKKKLAAPKKGNRQHIVAVHLGPDLFTEVEKYRLDAMSKLDGIEITLSQALRSLVRIGLREARP